MAACRSNAAASHGRNPCRGRSGRRAGYGRTSGRGCSVEGHPVAAMRQPAAGEVPATARAADARETGEGKGAVAVEGQPVAGEVPAAAGVADARETGEGAGAVLCDLHGLHLIKNSSQIGPQTLCAQPQKYQRQQTKCAYTTPRKRNNLKTKLKSILKP